MRFAEWITWIRPHRVLTKFRDMIVFRAMIIWRGDECSEQFGCRHDSEDENCEDDAWCTIQVEVVSLVLRNSWVAFTARVDDDTTITSALILSIQKYYVTWGDGHGVTDVQRCPSPSGISQDALKPIEIYFFQKHNIIFVLDHWFLESLY